MQKAILFIPDITGFTDFVKQTEISHSKHIIKELLELLIDSNQIELELVEIEGDALFFYKVDETLSVNDLVDQISIMYRKFHKHLQLYAYQRICNCGACTNAARLKLKFIVHEAEIEFIEVKGQRKPFGESVIYVHRLLKNKIPLDEYVLLSSQYAQSRVPELDKALEGSGQIDEEKFDDVVQSYHYFTLDHLDTTINLRRDTPEPILGTYLTANRVLIDAAPNDLFQFILDFEHRHLWSEGVDEVLYEPGEINQLGSKHTCVIGGNHLELSTVYKTEKEGELVFIERTEDAPIVKNLSTVFKIMPNKSGSLLDVSVYTKSQSILGRLLKPILKSKLKGSQKKSLNKLKEVVEKWNDLNYGLN